MKKWIALLSALLLTLSCAMAESPDAAHTATLSLDANPTTGYFWSGLVLDGDAARLDSAEGTYFPDDQTGTLTGAGGQTRYVVTAVQPGNSILAFEYRRSWEDAALDQKIYLAVVDQALNLTLTEITETGATPGTAPDGAEAAQPSSFAELPGLSAFMGQVTDDNPILSVSYTDGYAGISPEYVTDSPDEIQAILDAALAMEVGSVSDVAVTDWNPALRVTSADGQCWSAVFNGHWLTKDGVNYNLIGDEAFWKLLAGLRRAAGSGQ